MKLRLAIYGVVVGLILAGVFLLLRPGGAQKEAEATRQLLRQQGFKTDLGDFNFSTSPELRNRAVPLTTSGLVRPARLPQMLDLMAPVGSDAALIIWRQDRLPSNPGEDGWPALRESLNENHAFLDAASDAALSGPIRFDLNASAGNSMLLRHLAGLRNISQSFGSRAVLELHDQNKSAAWTNLLAATRLVTAWEPEPTEVSYMVRFTCADLAFQAAWQTLQAGGWEDDRLANLQHEWEEVDYFKGLPETAAFTRASMVSACQLARKQPVGAGLPLKDLIRSPRYAWANLSGAWQQFRYRHRGTFEDEKALLLFYRDRELLLRQIAQSPSWLEIRQLPGVTNAAPFKSNYRSSWQSVMNLKQLSLAGMGRGSGMLGRVAEAETHRRIVITAIALERFRGRHGAYPKTLAELSPDLLPQPLVDFMDGKPLRYRLTDDGHFVLYSVGLDCVDDGGQLAPPMNRRNRLTDFSPARLGLRSNVNLMRNADPTGIDLVWARPASAAEVKAQQSAEQRREDQRKAAMEAEAKAEERAAEDLRQVTVQRMLAEAEARKNAPPTAGRPAKEPVCQGKPLSQVLRNEKVLGAKQATLDELLTPRQIITGDEPGAVTFELPLNYDVVTNLGELGLVVDGLRDGSADSDAGDGQSCKRATNGDCLVIWDTTYAAPGQHVLQARFVLAENEEKRQRTIRATGPIMPFFSSNLFQFSQHEADFDPGGLMFCAKLIEPNGLYSIEIKTMSGQHLRTLTGRTTNGIIKEHWDLTDDRGQKYTNDTFDVSYEIKLPASGRSQKVK